jgi:hypothetical protein
MKFVPRSHKIVWLVWLLFSAGFLFRCANVMAPTGGPKDITPPKILEAVPPNHSIRFTGNTFSITFDEYVKLDKVAQQLLISPPMAQLPDFKIKKKTLLVRFKEPLKPNTTYSVFFGDAIQDVNEGNPLHDFTYVFSTGNTIDSMSLRGQVVQAQDLKPADGVFVMLYKNNNDTIPLDSLPLRVKPFYLSKTDKKGYFWFSGLADTSYLIFALKDENASLTFDQPSEEIAFLDTLVKPQYRPVTHLDKAEMDTLTAGLPSDSAQMVVDSLRKIADSLADSKLTLYRLYLFRQPDTVQKLMKTALVRPNTVRFVFNIPGKGVTIRSLNYHPDSVWYRSEWSSTGDTLTWFLRLPHPDTLNLLVSNGKNIHDTIDLRVIPKPKLTRKKKKTTAKKKVYLSWLINHTANIKPGEKLVLTFGQPVAKVIPDSILLVQAEDSLYHHEMHFLDSLHRRLWFPMKVKDGENYGLLIPDSTVIDWNGFFNKQISISLHSKSLKDYGSLNFSLQPSRDGHYIFEALGNGGKPVEIRYFSGSVTLHFLRMDPGTYTFKIIFDRNNNKKWDPGNYMKKQLPEKVIFFPGEIKIRANWDVNQKWQF